MRAVRIALLALLSLSVLDASSAFARGNGGAAGAGAGAGAGSGPGGGNSGGAGIGSVPLAYVIPDQGHKRHPRPFYVPGKVFSSCFKQDELYDRYGNAVVNQHGAECFQ